MPEPEHLELVTNLTENGYFTANVESFAYLT